MLIEIPTTFTKKHEQALTDYLTRRQELNTDTWRLLYEGIDLLDKAQIVTDGSKQTFRQLYTNYVERPFADQFIEELLTSQNIIKESPRIAASYARQIGPNLQNAGLVVREITQSWLLQAYCVYWWQSFARGYAFEVEINRTPAINCKMISTSHVSTPKVKSGH